MVARNPDVGVYMRQAPRWRDEMEALRAILLGCGLEEAVKWGKPCYQYKGGNVVIIQPFKATCALLFFKGALLADTHGLLEKPGKHSQAARRMVFRRLEEITGRAGPIAAYIQEAIAVEKAGATVRLQSIEEHPVPPEFQERLDEDPVLQAAFEALTPGRQRGYLLHIGGAKQSATRAARVEKHVPHILQGKGLHDR